MVGDDISRHARVATDPDALCGAYNRCVELKQRRHVVPEAAVDQSKVVASTHFVLMAALQVSLNVLPCLVILLQPSSAGTAQ